MSTTHLDFIMKPVDFLKLAAAASVLASSLAQALPVTYHFTGLTLDDPSAAVTGSLTIDTGTFSNSQSFPALGYAYGLSTYSSELDISFGPGQADSFHLPAGLGGQSDITVHRADGENVFEIGTRADSYGGRYLDFSLLTVDAASAFDSKVFDTPVTDVSLSQDVHFNTAGSQNQGYFDVSDPTTGFTLYNKFFIITSVSMSSPAAAVPEPSVSALMLAGLAVAGAVAGRSAKRDRDGRGQTKA